MSYGALVSCGVCSDFCVFLIVIFQGDIYDKLAQKAGANVLNDLEKTTLFTKFPNFVLAVQNNTLTIVQARNLYKNIRASLKSGTVALMRIEGFAFDGILSSGGGGKSVLYHVIDMSTYTVLCAKIYLQSEDSATIEREIGMSSRIHQEESRVDIVRYSHVLSLHHPSSAEGGISIALLMPLYPMSLGTVLDACGDFCLSVKQFKKLTRTLLSAAQHLEMMRISHCDIKPENIMLHNGEFVIIDLGACVNYGEDMCELTSGYGLHADTAGIESSLYDLNCIIVTLTRCCVPQFEVTQSLTRGTISRSLDHGDGDGDERVRVCLSLLQYNTVSNALAALTENNFI